MLKQRGADNQSNISFKPLLKLLVDRDIDIATLRKLTGISTSTMKAIKAHRSVTLDTLVKICLTLDCPIEAVVEIRKVDEGNV